MQGGGYKRNLSLLFIDLLLVVFIFYGLFQYCYDSVENIVTNVHGPFDENSFSYFTTLSNLFLLVVCLITIPYLFISIIKRKDIKPAWLLSLRFIAIICIVITFLIVNLVLVWLVSEPYELYEGKELFTHVLVPVLAVVSFFIYKSDKYVLSKKQILLANIPVLIYSVLYTLMVFILKQWPDFYSVGFWLPYSIPIFVILLFGLCNLVAFVLFKLKNRNNKVINQN